MVNMRIKEDFVTNSSSTSFTLKAVCVGRLPYLDIPDLTKALKKKFKPTKFEIMHYSDKDKFIMQRTILDHEWGQDSDKEDNSGHMYLEVENMEDVYYNEHDDEIIDNNMLIKMFVNTPTLWCEDENVLLNEIVIKYLKKILSLYKNLDVMVDLFYSQAVIEQYGDGWDGGDPMGPYQWTFQVYEKESKLGRIIGDKDVLRFTR